MGVGNFLADRRREPEDGAPRVNAGLPRHRRQANGAVAGNAKDDTGARIYEPIRHRSPTRMRAISEMRVS